MEVYYEKNKKCSIINGYDFYRGTVNSLLKQRSCYCYKNLCTWKKRLENNYTYIEKEDKVVKQTTKNEGIYAQLPSTKTKEETQKVLDPIAKKYQGIKGIKHSIDYQEDKFIEDLEVDYTNIDYEKAKEVLGKNFQDPAKTKISMKKTEELMNKMGYTEQK